jgi:hypothetical protein
MFGALLIGLALTTQVTNDFPAFGPIPTTLTVWTSSIYGQASPTAIPCKYNPATKQWVGSVILTNVSISPYGPVNSTAMFVIIQGDAGTSTWKMAKAYVLNQTRTRILDGATAQDTPSMFLWAPSQFSATGKTTWEIVGEFLWVNMPGGN